MNLEASIAIWDCKSRSDILAVHEAFGGQQRYVSELIRIAQNPTHADGATWLIKHAFEEGYVIEDFVGVLRAGARAQTWPAELHVLQMLPQFGVVRGGADYVEQLVRRAIVSPKSMVRAWGYCGCDVLGQSVERLASEMAAILAQARATETSGAVLARLRRCVL